ncbi:hypothetical protein QP028_12840 [Corynebacterium suedekumii]|nr:hypothetical protein QP028_12840 [Corynebacterium suedekumii]
MKVFSREGELGGGELAVVDRRDAGRGGGVADAPAVLGGGGDAVAVRLRRPSHGHPAQADDEGDEQEDSEYREEGQQRDSAAAGAGV